MGKRSGFLLLFLIILFNISSWGRVIFRPVSFTPNYQPNGVRTSASIDFNLDGISDIEIRIIREGVPVWPSSTVCSNPGMGTIPYNAVETTVSAVEVAYLRGSAGYISGTGNPLMANTLIGPSSIYSTSLSQGGIRLDYSQYYWNRNFSSNCYQNFSPGGNRIIGGSWTNSSVSDGYIGVKFMINGMQHYGYIKVNGFTYSGDVTITEIAYESVPGYPIKTGDKTGYLSDFFNPTANLIKGKVYYDADGNCTYNAGEKGIPDLFVYTTNGNYSAVTDANGNYEIYVQGGSSSYILDIDTIPSRGVIYTKTCPTGTIATSFNGNNQVSLNNNFSITTASCGNLTINIRSDRGRRCFRNNTTVYYSNTGRMSSAPATVAVIMPPFIKAISSTPAWSSQSGDTLFYNIGAVDAFSFHSIKIIDSVVCGNESIRGLTQCTQAIITPKNYCLSTANWDQSDIRVQGNCVNSVFMAQITNYGHDMTDSVSYRIFLDGIMVKTRKIKLLQGRSVSLELPVHGSALRIEVDQHSAHPEVSIRSLNYEGCGNFATEAISKNIIGQYPMNQNGLAIATSCRIIVDSYDPNDKQANPSGFGSDHKILPDGDIEYTIRFQNTGSDEAYTVVIVDTLDGNLDASSFQTIAASHSYKLEVTGKNSPRLAWIFGGINLPHAAGNEPASHGFITYRVSQKSALSTGTVLKNKAHIFFDYNSAILTNEVKHTIAIEYPVNILKVTTQPNVQQLCADKPLSLSSTGAGNGTLRYLWYKDGSPISSQTTSALTINNTAASDAGNYRCRIENRMDTLFTNAVMVAVHAKPAITVNGPIRDCISTDITNAFVDENATTGSVSYWKNTNTTISLSTPSAVTESGTYYIKKETSQGCADTEAIEVLMAIPEIMVTEPDAACTSVNITNAFVDENATIGSVSYWKDANATVSLSTPSAVIESGIYFIKKETSPGCEDTEAVEVEIYTNPELTVIDPEESCVAANITNSFVDANATTGSVSYWKDANATVSLSTPSSVLESGTYYIKKETAAGCEDVESVEVTVHTNPDLKVIDPEATCAAVDITNVYSDGNSTTGTISYWLDANATISLSTPATLIESGTYYIKKETIQGCEDIEPVAVEVTVCSSAIEELYQRYGLSIYPNPVSDKLIIENRTAQKVILYDSKGNIILSKELSGEPSTIDMKSFVPGMYHLNIKIGEQEYSVQVIKE